VCSATGCVAKTCSNLGVTCGSASDGCNGTLSCGSCSGNQICKSGTCAANTGTNGAQFISQTVPASMVTGQSYSVAVTMKNTGATVWIAAGQYRLGSQNPRDGWTWGLNRANLSDSESISAGQSKTFTFNVTAPNAAGNYNFQWRMVQDNVQWFGDSSTNISVVVSAPKKPDLATCGAASECQSNVCLDGYCGLKPNGWGCGSNDVCASNNCVSGVCTAKTASLDPAEGSLAVIAQIQNEIASLASAISQLLVGQK